MDSRQRMTVLTNRVMAGLAWGGTIPVAAARRSIMNLQRATFPFALVWLVIFAITMPARSAEPRPNILFILTDDLAFDGLAVTGNAEVQTPNLDELVRRGTLFTHAYNMGSWADAVCVSSRAMLNTGRTLWHAARLQRRMPDEYVAGRVWSEQFRRAGYRTYLTGKWHVNLNPTLVFDVVQHVRGAMPEQKLEGYNRPRTGQVDPWSPSDPKWGGYWAGGKHWTEVTADDAIADLQDASRSDQPFFMYVAFNAPHDPRQSPARFIARYPRDKITVPQNFLAEYPFKDGIGCGPELRDEFLAPFPRTREMIQVHRQEYYAIISHLDEQIGRVLTALKASGKAENTYIIFTSDHGLCVGQHGFLGKQNLYDASLRVPLAVIGPSIPANERRDGAVYLQDVVPTSFELAGLPVPSFVEFQSLLPLVRDSQQSGRDTLYGAYLNLQRMITADGYKLLVYPQIHRRRLYRVSDDPLEMHDLAETKSMQTVLGSLTQRLRAMQTELGDPVPLGDW